MYLLTIQALKKDIIASHCGHESDLFLQQEAGYHHRNTCDRLSSDQSASLKQMVQENCSQAEWKSLGKIKCFRRVKK